MDDRIIARDEYIAALVELCSLSSHFTGDHGWPANIMAAKGRVMREDNFALPPEPRTCETCGDYVAWLRWNGNTFVACDSDSDGAFRVYRQPFYPQSADVETVREVREALVEAKRRAEFVHGYSTIDKINEALAALDRIAWMLRG